MALSELRLACDCSSLEPRCSDMRALFDVLLQMIHGGAETTGDLPTWESLCSILFGNTFDATVPSEVADKTCPVPMLSRETSTVSPQSLSSLGSRSSLESMSSHAGSAVTFAGQCSAILVGTSLSGVADEGPAHCVPYSTEAMPP